MSSGKAAKKSLLSHWWWVALSCFLMGLVYLHAVKRRNSALQEMAFRCQEMERERMLALLDKEELELKIASQSDPAWIEMVLMREIGVVPEGWIKVHFKN